MAPPLRSTISKAVSSGDQGECHCAIDDTVKIGVHSQDMNISESVTPCTAQGRAHAETDYSCYTLYSSSYYIANVQEPSSAILARHVKLRVPAY